MKRRATRTFQIASVAATSAAVVLMGSPAANAAEGGVDVVNTETVQVYMSPSGDIRSQRVYEQLDLIGHGKVALKNPVSTDSLRNLNGFSGFDVEDGQQVVNATVDGEDKLRSVSDFDGKLPLKVSIDYKLDGKTVEPGDIVGKSGSLEVQFTVENVTGQAQEVTFEDGNGGTVTKTAEVPIPMVGSVTTETPSNFSNVASKQANMAGDGEGGTKLSFTMTLFPPIGSTTAVFGYTADITDGVIPRVEISALPVNPLESPTFKSAAASYQGGADTGAQLTAGATKIDSNLLKLRDGAAKLLAGLIKLNGGADQLHTGLADEAAAGAVKIADGAEQLDDGLIRLRGGAQQLADGTGRLDDGANELASGAGRLDDGASRLADGAHDASAGSNRLAHGAHRLDHGLDRLGGGTGQLSDGVDKLAAGQKALAVGLGKLYDGVKALPADVKDQLAADPQYNALLGALQSISAGVGTRGDSPELKTILAGLNKLQLGLDNPNWTPEGCLTRDPSRCGATNALDLIAAGLTQAMAPGGSVTHLKQAILNIGQAPDCGAVCKATVTATADGVEQAQIASLTDLREKVQSVAGSIRAGITEPGKGLDQLRYGLTTGANPATCAAHPEGCGIKEAADFLRLYGIPALVDGITQNISDTLLANIGEPTPGCDPTKTLRCAAAALADGGDDLTAGIDDLVAGVAKLQDGGAQLAAGAGTLSAGLGQLDNGAGQLADGTGQLRAGAGKLANGTGELRDGAGQLSAGAGTAADGSGQLADGAGRLADGLGDAASGSGRLADGLGQAADGAPKLVDGAQRLSDEGTKKLVAAGESTTQNYGEMVAVMNAGAERAQTEDMAYGAPEDSLGLTAYKFIIEGDDGEGGRNLTRGLAGLAILGAGAAVFGLRRRLV